MWGGVHERKSDNPKIKDIILRGWDADDTLITEGAQKVITFYILWTSLFTNEIIFSRSGASALCTQAAHGERRTQTCQLAPDRIIGAPKFRHSLTGSSGVSR